MREQEIQREILRYLHSRGIFAWKNSVGGFRATYKERERYIRMGMKGQPDIFGVLPGGRFLALEVKSAHGRLSAYQNAFLALLAKYGAATAVVRSVEQCHTFITSLGGTDGASQLRA